MAGMQKTAKRLDISNQAYRGQVKAYCVEPPMEGERYVLVSKVSVPGQGWETYVFPCDLAGNVTSWLELQASQRGFKSHEQVLADAGYEVVEGDS